MSRELTSGDVAKRNGIDRKTAYRWLRALHEEYGPSVVSRRGKRGVYVTTEDAFARVAVLTAKKAAEERRMREVEERLADAETRLDKQAAELADFRRRAAHWFSRQK